MTNVNNAQITITDIVGKVVYESVLDRGNSNMLYRRIDVKDFTKGIYSVTAKSGEQKYTQKLLIN